MNISGMFSSLNANSLLAPPPAPETTSPPNKTPDAPPTAAAGNGDGMSRALGMFRQELRYVLKAQFQARFTSAQPDYAEMRKPEGSDDVAEEALGAAKSMVAESPASAAKSLITFRAKVQETATYVRESVGRDQDIEDVDQAVAKVDAGVAKLEDEVSNYRESSASVLALDTLTRQQSRLRIRTQEGDVVTLRLKQVDSLSARQQTASASENSMTQTEALLSSRSRIRVRIEGDLNASEQAAIRNVLAQAENMASQFMGGNAGAAFDLAENFQFDSEQLARVRLNFSQRQTTRIAYAEVSTLQPQVNTDSSAPAVPAAAKPTETTATAGASAPEIAEAPENVTPVVADVQEVAEAPAELPPETPNVSLASLFDALSAFLRSVNEGFEGMGSGSFRYHYSESFKLSLLEAVVSTMEPEAEEPPAPLQV